MSAFADGEIALAEEALRALDPLGPPRAAFLGGSKAFGLGNALSDVDLTVVYDALPPGERRVRSFGDGEVFLHCELRLIAEYEPLCRRFAVDALPGESASLDAEALLGSHRRVTELLRGTYLRTSPEAEALRAAFVPERVDALSAAASAVVGSLSVRDAAGAALSGDALTAGAAARIALEHACDVALFTRGDPYRSRKFLPRRLARFPDLASLDLLAPGPARETLHVANGVQAAALLGLGPVWTPSPSGPGPVRSPYVTLVTTDGGFRLAGRTEFLVGRPAALLWLLADGRALPGLAARFAEMTGVSANDVTAFVETNVASLRRAGAVE